MSRWIAALLVQAILGLFLDFASATEDDICSLPIAADTMPAQALLQKGTRISESMPRTNVGLQMSAYSSQATRSEAPSFSEEDEGPVSEDDEENRVGPGELLPLRPRGRLGQKTSRKTTKSTTTPTGCKGEKDLLDFFNSNLANNNLGGKGPNAGDANIRYEAIGVTNGRSFDLVVAASGYTSNSIADNGYECGMSSATCTTGRYGQIDVAAGTSVDLTLSFQDSKTQDPVTLESFLFSLHDIDQLDSTVQEAVYISGFTGAALVSNSSAVSVDVQADGRTRLKSTKDECNGDDPLNPMFLGLMSCGGQTIDTKTRSAAFKFENKGSFSMTLEATCNGCAPGSHRRFMFTGDTNLVTCGSRQPIY